MKDNQFSLQLLKFGKAIKSIRQAQGLSQEAFADRCKLDRTYIGGVERGERNVSFININKIAKALNVSPSVLFMSVEDIDL